MSLGRDAAARFLVILQKEGEPEVREEHLPGFFLEKDIRRIEVTVENSPLMGWSNRAFTSWFQESSPALAKARTRPWSTEPTSE